MFVVAVDFAMDVYDGVVVGAVAAVGLLLCSDSMDSDFEHISFSLVAKRTHCEPWHSRKIECRLQSKRSLLSPASNGIV